MWRDYIFFFLLLLLLLLILYMTLIVNLLRLLHPSFLIIKQGIASTSIFSEILLYILII